MFLEFLIALSLDTALVIKVSDADTITLQKDSEKIKVRLYGVDAPEKKQPHGQASLDSLKYLIYQKEIPFQPISKDRYKRTIARIYLDSVDMNAWLVENGLAWYYYQYAKKDSDLKMLQDSARAHALGLWAEDDPEPPWEYRQRIKKENARKRKDKKSRSNPK